MGNSARKIIAWNLQVFLVLVFIKSGFDKLNQGPETATIFISINLPGWFTHLISRAELMGSIELLVSRMMRPAALYLISSMVGALVVHAVKISGVLANGRPIIMLLVLLSVLLLPRQPAAQVT